MPTTVTILLVLAITWLLNITEFTTIKVKGVLQLILNALNWAFLIVLAWSE